MTVCDWAYEPECLVLSVEVSGRYTGVGDRRMTCTGRHYSDSNQRKENNPGAPP